MQTKPIPMFILPDWFQKCFFVTQWYIHSTGRDDEGRTPFIMYHVRGRKVSVFTGQNLDSKKDYASIAKMNKEMAKVRRDFIRKQAQSEIDARNLWLT